MKQIRKPFQGVGNIIRFNWHFFVASFGFVVLLLASQYWLNEAFHLYIQLLCLGIVVTTAVSLLVSYYVYDVSNLYSLDWLNKLAINETGTHLNINAGFDETSGLLTAKYPNSKLLVYDFYDPEKHTEVSIKRARKAYPPFPNTQTITTTHLPLEEETIDTVFLILSAHEIRNEQERIAFFKELRRVLKPSGNIVVVEHQRDLPNFIAYTIGFLHFHSNATWLRTFKQSNFSINQTLSITPFITVFFLKK